MYQASVPSIVRSAVWNALKHCIARPSLPERAVVMPDDVDEVSRFAASGNRRLIPSPLAEALNTTG